MLAPRSRAATFILGSSALFVWAGCNALAGIDDASLDLARLRPTSGEGNEDAGGSNGSSTSSTSSASSASSASSSSSSGSSTSSSGTIGPVGSCNGLAAYSVNDPGVTSPSIVDQNLNGPMGVATDGVRIVYSVSGQTQQQICGSVKVSDTGAPRIISNWEVFPTNVILNGNFAYFVDAWNADPTSPNVRRALATNTSQSGATIAGNRLTPTSIRVQSSTVYFTDKNGVYSCDMSSGSPECGSSPDTVISRSVQTRALVTTAARLAWIEAGGVFACDRTNCAATVVSIASGQINPREMAIDGTTLYWTEDGTNENAGNVWSASIDGTGAITPLLCGLGHPVGVAVDGSNVYVTNRGTSPDFTNGTVIKCAKTGCANRPTVMAKNQTQPYGVAVDSTRLVWTTKGMDVGAGSSCNSSAATGTVATVPK